MDLQANIPHWLQQDTVTNIMVAYGSLLSHDSRLRYSNIDVQPIPVTLRGYQRGWFTRSPEERQTYLGAVASSSALMSACLIPVEFNPSFQHREKDYQFRQVEVTQLLTAANKELAPSLVCALSEVSVWICESLEMTPASSEFPVNQTYIDTCLAGCIEQGGESWARRFIDTTSLWQHPRNNDRSLPKYPRAANCERDIYTLIDSLQY